MLRQPATSTGLDVHVDQASIFRDDGALPVVSEAPVDSGEMGQQGAPLKKDSQLLLISQIRTMKRSALGAPQRRMIDPLDISTHTPTRVCRSRQKWG